MNVDKAIHTLIAVATALFSEGSQVVTDPEASSIKPKETIDLMFETRETPVSTRMYERAGPQPRCKVEAPPRGPLPITHS